MKMKVGQAMFATLNLTLGIAASQRAMNKILINHLSDNDPELGSFLTELLSQEADKELALLRASILQFAEIDVEDLLNGTFEV